MELCNGLYGTVQWINIPASVHDRLISHFFFMCLLLVYIFTGGIPVADCGPNAVLVIYPKGCWSTIRLGLDRFST